MAQGLFDADVERRLRLLEATSGALSTRFVAYPTAWVAVTAFTNSWVNSGGTDQFARYRLIGDVVYVEGLIKSGTIGLAAFTLPAGFRPPASVYFASNASGAAGVFYILSTGAVTPQTGTTTYFSINCQFSVA